MSEVEAQKQKLDMERDQHQELKIWFFIARKEKLEPEIEMVQATLAYTLEDALLRAKQEAKDLNVVYHGQNTTVKELIEKIYLEGIVTPKITDEKLPEIPPKEMSRKQFIYNILLAADTMIKDPEKRKQLKALLKEIKTNEKNK